MQNTKNMSNLSVEKNPPWIDCYILKKADMYWLCPACQSILYLCCLFVCIKVKGFSLESSTWFNISLLNGHFFHFTE